MFTTPLPFDESTLGRIPNSSGCWILHDGAGPVAVGRSSYDIRRQLTGLLQGFGNRNVRLLLRGNGGLRVNWNLLPMSLEQAAERELMDEIGVLDFHRLRAQVEPADWESLA